MKKLINHLSEPRIVAIAMVFAFCLAMFQRIGFIKIPYLPLILAAYFVFVFIVWVRNLFKSLED